MAWFADLIGSGSVTGSEPALAVRLAAVTDPNAYVPVRIVSSDESFNVGNEARLQSRIEDNTTSGTGFMFIGYSDVGTATSETEWAIKRIEFVTDDPVHIQWTSVSASWDDRLTETYG